MVNHPIPSQVNAIFENYPASTRKQLLTLRDIIFDVAAKTDGVGPLEETLKWGQISYLTPETKSGTTIRIDAAEGSDEQLAIFVHCQTSLIDTFRHMYHEAFEFDGTRCMRFTMNRHLQVEALEEFIALALTYHLNKKQSK